MAVLKNRAKMSTSTTGTGTITLGSAEDGYQSFADAGVANGDVVRYVIEDGNNFEIGTGTYTSSGTTLSRTVSESSNSDAAINLSGSATVFIGAAAEDVVGGPRGADFDDNVKVRFGTTPDLEIYSDGTKSVINEIGSSHLVIQGQEIQFNNAAGTRLMDINSAQVELRHSGNKKMETNSAGIQTTGTVNVNGAYTLPTSDGTNGQVLTTDGSGAVTFADAGGGGGGADLYAANESSPSAQPSATGANAIAIGDSAVANNTQNIAIGYNSEASTGTYNFAFGSGATANASYYAVAIGSDSGGNGSIAGGNGSFATSGGVTAGNQAQALGKAYASGSHSFAAAIANNTSSYGATGANSIAIGKLAKATGGYATAIGESTQAQGNNSVCLGYYSQSQGQGTMVMGYDAQSTAVHCTAIGTNTRNAIDGTFKFSGGKHSAAGDAQVGIYPVLCETTDATATTFVTYHSNTITPQTDNQIVLPNNSAYAFSGTIIARQKASEGTACAAWKIEGLIRREGSAGTTVLVNSAKTVLDNTPSWDVTLSADTTNGCLKIQGTGAASTNIRWSSTITTSELTYA